MSARHHSDSGKRVNSDRRIDKFATEYAYGLSDSFALDTRWVTSRFLSKEEALFVQSLIDVRNSEHTSLDEEGFFLCTSSHLWETLRWTRNEQSRILRRLKARGLVRTKYKGAPGKRWVYVYLTKILEGVIQGLERWRGGQ